MADDAKKIEETTKATEKQTKATNEQAAATKKLAKIEKMLFDERQNDADFAESLKKNTNLQKGLNSELNKGVGILKDLSNTVSKSHIKGLFDTKKAEEYNKKLSGLMGRLRSIRMINAKTEKGWKYQQKAVKKLNGEIENTAKDLGNAKANAKSFTDIMEESGPGFMKSWAKFKNAQKEGNTQIQNYGSLINKAGDSLGTLPGLLGKAGAAAKGLGGALGGVSKIFAGWPGAILMGVKALWDVGMVADQFVKDANKSFAYVRGPDIMTSDIKGQFKDFNDQIYSMGDNLRTATDVTQIRELMEAMTQAGKNIQDLNKGLLTYRDAIYVASKASKTLGMTLPQVGGIMGQLMTDFRMDLESIDKSFVQVAFDAKKSGLSTDRFWGTIQNASASLALYGVFVNTASKTMKAFTESAVGGAKESSEATEDMFNVFKQGGIQNKAAIIQFAKEGGTNFAEAFTKAAADLGAKNVDIKSQIEVLESKDKPDVEEIKKLRAQLYANESRIADFQSVSKKSAVEQSTYLGALAGETPEILMNMLKGLGKMGKDGDLSKVSDQKMLVLLKSATERGLNENTVRMLIGNAKATRMKMTDLATDSADHFKNLPKKNSDASKKLQSAITKVMSTTGDNQINASAALSQDLQDTLKIDKFQADLYADMVRLDKDAGKNLGGLLKGEKDSLAALQKLVVSQDMVQQMTSDNYKKQEKTEQDIAAAAEDTFKGVVDQTLSFKEMTEIAKDDLKWKASSLGLAQALNQGVFNIFSFMVRNEKGYKSASQKAAESQLKAQLAGNEELKKLLDVDKKGNITRNSQVALANKLGDNLASLKETIKGDLNVGNAIDAALKSGSASGLSKASTGGTGAVADALNSFSKVQENLEKKIYNTDGFKDLGKNLIGAGFKEDETKDVLNQLKVLNKTGVKDGKAKEKFDALRNKVLLSMKTANAETLKENQKQKSIQEKMQANLNTLDKSNALIAKYTWFKVKNDPEMMKEMANEAESRVKEGDSYSGVARKMGVSMEQLKESLESQGKSTVGITAAIRGRKVAESGAVGTAAGTHYFAGLQEPIKVTSSGNAILHEGEKILPASMNDLQTVPVMGGGGPLLPETKGGVAGGGGGSGKKEFNINVTATEERMGQKIAAAVTNAIRAYDFQKSQTDMA